MPLSSARPRDRASQAAERARVTAVLTEDGSVGPMPSMAPRPTSACRLSPFCTLGRTLGWNHHASASCKGSSAWAARGT